MKIISKRKDYYDYLQGIYDVDENLVLDRRESDAIKWQEECIVKVIICNKMYEGFRKHGIFYWGKQLDEISMKIEIDKKENIKLNHINTTGGKVLKICNNINIADYENNEDVIFSSLYSCYNRNNNKKNDCPILLCIEYISPYSRENFVSSYHKWPNLQDMNFSKCGLEPQQIWIELSNWLSAKIQEREIVVPIGDDKIRIQSHGFDLKTSFRNMKR